MVVVAVAVTLTVAILKEVLVVLKVSVPPLPVTVNVLVENLVMMDKRPICLVSVGTTVIVVVGLMVLVLVTVSVLSLATDVLPSSVRQVISSPSAAKPEATRNGRRAVKRVMVFMMEEEMCDSVQRCCKARRVFILCLNLMFRQRKRVMCRQRSHNAL